MDKVFVHFQKASNQDSSADMWLETTVWYYVGTTPSESSTTCTATTNCHGTSPYTSETSLKQKSWDVGAAMRWKLTSCQC